MPFGLKNHPFEIQNIMNDILNPYTTFTIVYIDDVVIYSNSLKQHFKHLNIFLKVAKSARLVISARRMELFQISVRFLGYNIHKGIIYPLIKPSSLLTNFRIKP